MTFLYTHSLWILLRSHFVNLVFLAKGASTTITTAIGATPAATSATSSTIRGSQPDWLRFYCFSQLAIYQHKYREANSAEDAVFFVSKCEAEPDPLDNTKYTVNTKFSLTVPAEEATITEAALADGNLTAYVETTMGGDETERASIVNNAIGETIARIKVLIEDLIDIDLQIFGS